MPPARWFSTIVVALLTALAAVRRRIGPGQQQHLHGERRRRRRDGADAVQARQQGIAEARAQGGQDAGRPRGGAEDRARVPPPNDASLDGMVRGIEFVARALRGRPLYRHLERRCSPPSR